MTISIWNFVYFIFEEVYFFYPLQALYNSIKNEKLQWTMWVPFILFSRGYFCHLFSLHSQAYLRSYAYISTCFSSPCPKYSCSVRCTNEALTLIEPWEAVWKVALLRQVEVCVLPWADVSNLGKAMWYPGPWYRLWLPELCCHDYSSLAATV